MGTESAPGGHRCGLPDPWLTHLPCVRWTCRSRPGSGGDCHSLCLCGGVSPSRGGAASAAYARHLLPDGSQSWRARKRRSATAGDSLRVESAGAFRERLDRCGLPRTLGRIIRGGRKPQRRLNRIWYYPRSSGFSKRSRFSLLPSFKSCACACVFTGKPQSAMKPSALL